MKKALWELLALPGTLSQVTDQDQVKEIFEKEFFDRDEGKLRPIPLKDTEGITVRATEENFGHIFFKKGLFLIDRAERVYWIKPTILKSRYIVKDKDSDRRFHYLQPYSVGGNVESFCVVTKKAATGKSSIIITAFPVEWERVYAILSNR